MRITPYRFDRYPLDRVAFLSFRARFGPEFSRRLLLDTFLRFEKPLLHAR